MDHAVVRLRLIGPMEAWTANSENVLPSGRKTRALLACITMSTPRPVLRSRLIEQLWSRSPEEQARASLRQEIHRLRDALSPVETNILLVNRDHLALRPGAVSTDVQEVTQAAGSEAQAIIAEAWSRRRCSAIRLSSAGDFRPGLYPINGPRQKSDAMCSIG